MKKVKCEQCEKMFWKGDQQIKKTKHYHFCSNECKYKYSRNHKFFRDKQDRSIFNKLIKIGDVNNG